MSASTHEPSAMAVLTAEERWRIVVDALARPSYRARLRAMRRIHDAQRRSGDWEPVWSLVDKFAGYEFARSHGVRHPEVYAHWMSFDAVDWTGLPDRFVLKATTGHSANAVWALVEESDATYANVLTGRRITRDAIVDRLRTLHDRNVVRAEHLLAEELLDDRRGNLRPPIDWKVYCFYGEVGMIMARDTGGSLRHSAMRYRYWDADWKDLGQTNLDNVVSGRVPRPYHPNSLVKAAAELSRFIPRAHVRLDFYDTPDCIYFGEVSLIPGGPYRLTPEVDAMLGTAWEEAEARLQNDLLHGGALNLVSPAERRAGQFRPSALSRFEGRLPPWLASQSLISQLRSRRRARR